MTEETFKTCSCCGWVWATRDLYLADPDVVLIGYQVQFEELTAGVFLFIHNRPSCGTTLAIRCAVFVDLHDGPIFTTRRSGTESCPGHCLHRTNLAPCPLECECHFVREVMQVIKNWPKQRSSV